MQGRPMLMPALWGGAALGVLSALPFVSAFNLCCCAWVMIGGVLAAYVLQANSTQPITIGDGAIVGLLAGVFGAFIYGAVSVPMNVLLGPVQRRAMSRMLDNMPNVPAELRDALGSAGSPEMAVFGLLMGVVMMLFAGSVFATVGGVLGAVFFRKKTADVPPSPFASPEV